MDSAASNLPKAGAGHERWFRLELDPTGKVVTCQAVERAELAVGDVVYVRARSEEQAIARGLNAYRRVARRRLEAKRRTEGSCPRCGGTLEPGERRCTTCRERARVDRRQERAEARGEAVERVEWVPHREREITAARRDALREAKEVFLAADVDEFLAWLNGEIGDPTEAAAFPEPAPAPAATPAPLVPRRRTDSNTFARTRKMTPRPATERKGPTAPAWMAKPLKPPSKNVDLDERIEQSRNERAWDAQPTKSPARESAE